MSLDYVLGRGVPIQSLKCGRDCDRQLAVSGRFERGALVSLLVSVTVSTETLQAVGDGEIGPTSYSIGNPASSAYRPMI